MRLGFRPRHALVLQRGVQYFRVERVSGNEVPHQLQTPMTTLPFTTAANALINGRDFGAGIVSGFAAHRP
jgi:hypothetical protein